MKRILNRGNTEFFKNPSLRLCVSAVKILFLVLLLTSPARAADQKESAYDRVIQTQTIRCGYGTWAPWIYQDLKTGQMAGVSVTIMNAVADELGLKLLWPEETGWGQLPTSLADGRVDVACSTMWRDPQRGKQVAFTTPLYYTPVYAWEREGDTRFHTMDDLNKPTVRLAVQDGDMSMMLAKRYFPKAQLVTLPSSAQASDIFLNVTSGKADVSFQDAVSVLTFNKSQKIKLRQIPLPHPITVYGASLAVGIHETALKEMLETTVQYMLNTGKIADLTADFRRQYPGAILLSIQPYEKQ